MGVIRRGRFVSFVHQKIRASWLKLADLAKKEDGCLAQRSCLTAAGMKVSSLLLKVMLNSLIHSFIH